MKHFFITLLVLQSLIVVGQNDTNRIKADFKAFTIAMEKLNFEHFMDMTYPPVFEIYDREEFKQSMQEAFEGNDEMRLEFVELSDTDAKLSQVFELSNPKTKYAFITYPTKMKMTFLNQSFDEDMKQMMIMMMQSEMMKIEFLNSNTLMMDQKSMMIAINDAKTKKKWKYLNYDTEMDMSDLIPEKIINDANNYYQAYLNGN
jgi:hypothetical protein